MQQDYRFVCCLLSVWNLSDTEQTTQTEGVSTTGWRGKYFGTRRRKETEIRESCTGSFSASFVMLEKLLVWSRRSGWSHRCDMWSAYWKEKCIPGLDGSTWGKDSIYVHKYIHIHPHSTYIHTYIYGSTNIRRWTYFLRIDGQMIQSNLSNSMVDNSIFFGGPFSFELDCISFELGRHRNGGPRVSVVAL